MQKKQRRKNKFIKLYFVCDADNPYLDPVTKIPNVLCVTSTKDEAKEYIDKRLFAEYGDHYAQWCSLRKIPMNSTSWNNYKKLNPRNYFYEKHSIEYNSISSLFRLFYGCLPIGCSFDTLIETSTLLDLENREKEEKVEA